MTLPQKIKYLAWFGLCIQALSLGLIYGFLGAGPAIAIFLWSWGNNIQLYVKMVTEKKNGG